jgi:uncharacterized membrane-anchored protein YhcB (DUF1043 family)
VTDDTIMTLAGLIVQAGFGAAAYRLASKVVKRQDAHEKEHIIHSARLDNHGARLDNHEVRIVYLEKKVE